MTETQTSFFIDTLDEWIDKKIDEADIDLADPQVRGVIQTMYELVTARAKALRDFADVVLRMHRGKASMQEVDAITAKLDDDYAELIDLLFARLWDAGIDFDDEKVIEALTFAKEVLVHIHEHEFHDLSPRFDTNAAQGMLRNKNGNPPLTESKVKSRRRGLV
jgi:hypothetical protein